MPRPDETACPGGGTEDETVPNANAQRTLLDKLRRLRQDWEAWNLESRGQVEWEEYARNDTRRVDGWTAGWMRGSGFEKVRLVAGRPIRG